MEILLNNYNITQKLEGIILETCCGANKKIAIYME